MSVNIAKNYMESYQSQKHLLNRINTQIIEKRELLDMKGVSYDGVKVQTNEIKDHVGDAIADIADLSVEYREVWESAFKNMEEIEETVNRIESEKLKLILIKHYLKGDTWLAIADELGVTERHIYRLRDDGLKEIEKIINNDIVCQ